MRETLEHALALIEGANGLAIREDASWPMYREAFQAALAAPSSPASSPSPAGGVREALQQLLDHPTNVDVIAAARAALSSPATPEPVSAPAGEVDP